VRVLSCGLLRGTEGDTGTKKSRRTRVNTRGARNTIKLVRYLIHWTIRGAEIPLRAFANTLALRLETVAVLTAR